MTFITDIIIELNFFYSIVVTRFQLENLSTDKLIDKLMEVENIEDKLEHLNKQLDNFLYKYNEIYSELHVSKNCSNLLRNALSTA